MATNSLSSVTQDQYLQLLVAQLQNQNPLDPVSDKDLIAQLAQFSSLQGITQLNTSFDDMLQLQQLTQGNSLIGRTVTYTQPPSTTLASGVVSGLVVEDGKINLRVGSAKVPLSQVQGVEQTPA
jgi:flagellar basal-body rod modification protein FlgD